MEPWQSWAVVLAGGGLAYYYYIHQHKPSTKRQPLSPVASTTTAKSNRKDKPSNHDSDKISKNKGETRLNHKASHVEPTPPSQTTYDGSSRYDDDQSASDKAWARQLAEKRKGVTLSSSSQQPRGRTTQSTNVPRAHAAQDVSDMLEAPAQAPSVMRLTSTDDTNANKSHHKEFEQAQSKKQRQNRRKVEERKLERDAAEQERQKALEVQRRTAREARGEPAKNGLGAVTAKSPWTGSDSSSAKQSNYNTHLGPLLDTFDSELTHVSENSQTSVQRNGVLQQNPSDHEITGTDDGWNTVAKKKVKKALSTQELPLGEQQATAPVAAPAMQLRQTVHETKQPTTNGSAAKPVDHGIVPEAGTHPDDSAWAA